MTRAVHFERFQDHTLLKHFLLDAYLKRWATILLSTGFSRVWFIDAFAGAGSDQNGNPGSPVIAARIAEDVNATFFPTGITGKTGMHVVAIESDLQRFASLQQAMDRWTSMKPTYVYVRQGVLETFLSGILKHSRNDPVLFFLDPFGIDGLSAEIYPRALSADHNELLVLFNDEGAVRLQGKATAKEAAAFDPVAEVLAHPSLFGAEDDALRLQHAQAKAERSVRGHKSNPRAAEIMNRAFGSDSWQSLMRETIAEDRQRLLRVAFEGLLVGGGARFVLPFSVDTSMGRHKYYLIHASLHKRAFTAMKDAMHRARNERAKRSSAHQQAIQWEASTNLNSVIDELQRHFAGRLVRWSNPKGESVQDHASETTAIWNHELPALKEALLQLGWGEKAGKAQAFRFPDMR